MKTKTFDAAEMKRAGAARVQALLAGKSPAEEFAYWKKQEAALRHQQAAAQARTPQAS